MNVFPQSPINNTPALFQFMAWHLINDGVVDIHMYMYAPLGYDE